MNKKFMAWVLTVVMILGMMPVAAYATDGTGAVTNPTEYVAENVNAGEPNATTETLSGSGTEADPYQISSVEDLILFRDQVNSGKNYAGQYVMLTDDIDLGGADWTPIGDVTYAAKYVPEDTSKVFSGVFDGNDKVISNLKMSKTVGGNDPANAQANLGLFGVTGEGAEIKDLTITNVTISTDGRNVAAVVGHAHKTKLENITVNGDINITGGHYVAGICGMTRTMISATDLTVSGEKGSFITGQNIVGGIAPEITSETVKEQPFSNLSVENVALTGVSGVGGIIGLLTDASVSDVTVKNVVITAKTLYNDDPMGRIRMGSVVGLLGNKGPSTVSGVELDNVTGKNLDGAEVTLPVVGANYTGSNGNATEASVGDQYYARLQDALNAAAAASGEVTVEILADVDLSGIDWNPVTVSASGYPVVTVNGNDHTIYGLTDMLFAGTWAGGSGLIINDLTIKNSTIVNDKDDAKETVGVGAFVGFPQASATVTLNNCHLVDSTVEGGHWTGGLVGYAAGYAGTDGPVFMELTITDCSVIGSTITGKGSAGSVIGHASGNAWTKVVINNTIITGNTVTSTGNSTNKAGSVLGTIGAAGQATTVNGVTKTGGVFVNAKVFENEVTSGGTEITTIYGRQGSTGGKLVLTVGGGMYDQYPIEKGKDYAVVQDGYLLMMGNDVWSLAQKLQGEGTQSNPIRINSILDLCKLSACVNEGDGFQGKYILLNSDLDLAGMEWTPIGTSDNPFKGTFDGGNHTISNLVITGNNNYVGLFGYTTNGEIKNLTVNNAQVSGRVGVGAVAGSPYTSKYTNITLTGHVEINGLAYVGGVGGRNAYADWTNITVDVDETSYVKAVSTENGNNYRTYVGGVIGFNGEDAHTFKNITSNIDVIGNVSDVGGVFGIAHYNNNFVNITCSGDVTNTNNTEDKATDVLETGGIAGVWHNKTGTQVTFADCVFTGTLNTPNVEDVEFANGGLVGAAYSATETGKLVILNTVATIGDTPFYTLKDAIAAAEDGDTITLKSGVELSEGTIKLPETLKDVTLKGDGKTTVLKDMVITAADGNTVNYDGLTFEGIVFDNSYVVITGWRTGEVSVKNLTIKECVFKNIDNTGSNAAFHINVDADEAVNGFTFIDNVIDGATGGSKSGVYAQVTGTIVITGNVINNVAFRPILIQITTNDGIEDTLVVENNTFSGSAAGRLQVLGNVANGTDSVSLSVTGNIITGITNAQQICFWNFNEETTTTDFSKNYYDIDVESNPSRFYYNKAMSNVAELVGAGFYPCYTELNADGTIDLSSLYTPAPTVTIGDEGYYALQDAFDAAEAGDVVKVMSDIELTNSVSVAAGKEIVLDLNGYTVSFSPEAPKVSYLIENKGKLTIQDSSEGQTGLMTTYAANPDIEWGTEGFPTYANNTISNRGELIVQSGTIENTSPSGGASYCVDNYDGGSLTVLGGKIVNANNIAIRQFASSATASNLVKIEGGEIEGTRAVWVQLASSNTNVAPIVGLTVTGGTLSANKIDSSDNKLAVYSYSYGNDMKNVTIDISGGTFNGDVALTGGANKTNIETVTVTGGTFNGRWGDLYSYGADDDASETINISGGTFATEPYEVYLAEGYGAKYTNEGYVVVEKEYTIMFMDGRDIIYTISGKRGDKIELPEEILNPKKEGYEFRSWSRAIPETMPAEDLIIKANWQVGDFTITFIANGSVYATITKNFGTAISAPADPTREDFTFGGWEPQVPETMPGEDMTITAKWISNLKVVEQPEDVTVKQNEDAVFTVQAAGAGLKYHWQYSKDGGKSWAYTGAVGTFTDTITIGSGALNASKGNIYRCEITDKYGDVTYSESAALTVENCTLEIVEQPEDVTVKVGTAASITFEVEGCGELTYQWYYMNAKGAGGVCSLSKNSNTLDLPKSYTTLARDGWEFYCVVTDTYGNEVTTESATLTVENYTLEIVAHPEDVSVYVGESVKFAVEAAGEGELSYQWYYINAKGESFICSGATGATLSRAGSYTILSRNGFQFYCVVTDTYGNEATSDAAVLTIEEEEIECTLAITAQPEDVSVYVGESVKFAVEAAGEGKLSYQWYYINAKGESFICSGNTSATLSRAGSYTILSRNGFQFYCVVTDECGNKVISDAAVLTIEEEEVECTLEIMEQPEDVTVKTGTATSITFEVEGDGELSYQWYYMNAKGVGGTCSLSKNSNTLVLPKSYTTLARNGFQFYCVVTDECGNEITSDVAVMTVVK